MKKIPTFKLLLLLMLGIVSIAPSGNALADTRMIIVNTNAPGVGFNDPTPAAPVGGNTGTTLGQQRLIAFQHAADIWGVSVSSPDVPVRIRAQFTPLGPGILGSASPVSLVRDFPDAPGGVWFHIALANKLAGKDLNPAGDHITATFSTNFDFYLGLDNNHGPKIDLVTVLLHEFAHGLGFSQFASLETGALFGSLPDAYNLHLLDLTTGLHWNEMTDSQRQASAASYARVVWDGAFVRDGVPNVLSFGSPGVHVIDPAAIVGPFQFGTAAFGPAIGHPTVLANIVEAVDPADFAGRATTDGCSAITNAAAVAGKIALIESGTCSFAQKARNATSAGAAAVIIYNNVANAGEGPPGMTDDGINGQFVLIPSVSIKRVDGLSIIGQIRRGVTAQIGVDLNIRAGADAVGRARVFAPIPVVGGSIAHYDTIASRNLLMEPTINGDLTHKVGAPNDLTVELLKDVGWDEMLFADADRDGVADVGDCNPNSDVRPTIFIGTADTGVPNRVLADGCSLTDMIAQLAASAKNHGEFVLAVAQLTNQWVQSVLITDRQKGAIQRAAARTPRRLDRPLQIRGSQNG